MNDQTPKLEDVATVSTVGLLLTLYIISFGIRTLCEAVWPQLQKATDTVASRVWVMFLLPLMPSLLGCVLCLVMPSTLFPYPKIANVTYVSRAMYGLIVGWFTAGGYKLVKALIFKKWQIALQGADSVQPEDQSLPTGKSS